MIPGHPPNTTYRTIAAEDFGVLMCGAQDGCKKDFGWRAHHHGKVDRAGTIHWTGADRRATRRGMRQFMKLMAVNYHNEWLALPKWQRLHLSNVWAWREVQNRYHYRIRAAWSYQDRKVALAAAQRSGIKRTGSLRWKHRRFFKWCLDAGLLGAHAVQSHSQEGDLSVE